MTCVPRAVVLLAAVALSLPAAVVIPAPASAHPVVTGSDPSDGARVPEAVTEVRIEFSEPVTPLEVIVTGPSGAEIQAGDPELVDEAVVQPLHPFQERGDHTVTYRLIAVDDHITEGSFSFRYTGPVPDSPQDPPGDAAIPEEDARTQAEPTAEPESTAEPERTPEPERTAEPEPTVAPEPPTTDDGPRRSVWPLVITTSLVGLVIAGTVRTLRSIGPEDRD